MSQLVMKQVIVAKEVDGIEMGVLEDGTPYLTGRALARLCGAAVSTIINQKDEWAAGRRANRLARMLVNSGYEEPQIHIAIRDGAQRFDAYPEAVCMTFLEYYGFEAAQKSEQAQNAFRRLARGGFRLFVYGALGYVPATKKVPDSWRKYHDRLLLHSAPSGYFSVFKESADFVLAAIREGLTVDEHVIPDISIGQRWRREWETKDYATTYGESERHDHYYPDYFPQSKSNPQPIHVYPVDALGEFRRWMEREYIPKAFHAYLNTQIKKGIVSTSTAEVLLKATTPTPLLAAAGGDEDDKS